MPETSAGWGIGGLGLSPWGLGTSALVTGVSVSHAVLLSENTVRVFLTGPVRSASPYVTGDALNPATWEIYRLPGGEALTVAAATAAPDAANAFDLQTSELLLDALTTYQVDAQHLLDSSGAPLVPPRQADFLGVNPQVDPPGGLQRRGPVDLINYPAPRNPLGGTLQINTSGDYTTVQGRELVKKLIYRRLTTFPGEFFHLPTYGLALLNKGIQTATSLVKFRAEVERQALLEPEVAQARAAVSLSPDGVLILKLTCVLRADGATLDVNLQLPLNAPSF